MLLTGFEFVPATDLPQLVRLRHLDEEEPLLTFVVLRWLAVDLRQRPIQFGSVENLVIEGEGVGRPYWDGEPLPWTDGLNPTEELHRIAQIRRAVDELRACGGSILGMK